VNIEADNSNALLATVYVLDYGCLYRGGYIFAFIEDPNPIYSVGGKVLSTVDQSSGITWSSNGSSTVPGVSLDDIPGIDETSTALTPSPTFLGFETKYSTNYSTTPDLTPSDTFNNCAGSTDGDCNSANILNFYNAYITNYEILGTPPFTPSAGPTPLTEYAAGLCDATIATYSDWYLPAICEMGIDDAVPESGCGTIAAPTLQTIQTNLVTPAIVAFTGTYFSSTQLSTNQNYVWKYSFADPTGTISSARKGTASAVRCVRDFGHCMGRGADVRVCRNSVNE